MSEYQWGDKVWLDQGTKAIIIDIDEDDIKLPYRVATNEHDTEGDTDWVRGSRLSPREDDEPKTWRLPEVGDTIEVILKDDPWIGNQFKITRTNWDACSPIVIQNIGMYDVADVKLVRLHDDHIAAPDNMIHPAPPEPAPTVKCRFKVGDPVIYKGSTDEHGKVVAVSEDGQTVKVSYHDGRYTLLADDKYLIPNPAKSEPKFKVGDPVWCCGLPARIEEVKYEPGGWWTYGCMSGVTALSEQRWTEQFITTRDVSHESAKPGPTDADVSAIPNRMVTTLTCDSTPQADPVEYPSHYHQGGIHAMDVVRAYLTPEQYQGYLLATSLLYLLRANHKGDFAKDVRKAGKTHQFLVDSLGK